MVSTNQHQHPSRHFSHTIALNLINTPFQPLHSTMPSPGRKLLSRLSRHSTQSRTRRNAEPKLIDQFKVCIIDEERIRSILPCYTLNTPIQQTARGSTYYSIVDEPRPPVMVNTVVPVIINRTPQYNIAVEEIINRLRESLMNPKSWRLHNKGSKSFFWAHRCVPEVADMLGDNVNEIKDRILRAQEWRVEKFCVLFKRKKLEDLWCHPIHIEVSSPVECN